MKSDYIGAQFIRIYYDSVSKKYVHYIYSKYAFSQPDNG
jgi:hypothetical protein